MKVFRKKKREIIIDGHAFSWIVNETATHVKVRCYSLKSTYIEVIFNWGIATWAINFYQPSVVSTMIQYAIKLGWKYQLLWCLLMKANNGRKTLVLSLIVIS